MRSYGPTRWLDYYDTQAILCTGYYTSRCIQLESKLPDALHCTLPSTLWSTLLIALDCTLPACTIRSQLLSMAHSQPAWLTLPSKLSRRSQVHLRVRTQVHLRVALKYTLNCTRWHTPSLLDYTFSSKLSRRSQAHSRASSQVHSQFHLMTHSQPAWLYAPKSALKTLPQT